MPTAWNIGETILDLYRVSDRLGEGGFGQVYKVRHTGWNIDLAAKIPKPEIIAAAGGVEEFEREAETWVNLGLHPHTVSCYYVRRIDRSPVVFAEYVAGGSLHDWIANRQLYAGGQIAALQRIIDLAIQFAWGLDYAHQQGLIHQDVKPANVMMTPDGAVKVTDFGLANPRTMATVLAPGGESSGENYTMRVSGSGAMTPAYCSPEQANRDILTRRTDLWSWGLSVLEMFQGERTWGHGTFAAQALENYLEEGSADPQLPRMPMSVAELLQRCFQYEPAERPHDLLVVGRELQEIYQQETGEIYPRQEPQAAQDAADSLNNRAVSLFDLGKQEEALQVWEQALQVQPHHLEATYNRGLILWRSAKIDDSALLRSLEEARNSHPGNWHVNYLFALVYLEQDNCKRAAKIIEGIYLAGAQDEETYAIRKEVRDRSSGTVNSRKNPYIAPMRLSQVLATETVFSTDRIYQQELEQGLTALEQGDYVVAARHIRKARSQLGYNRRQEAFDAWAKLYVFLPRKAFVGSWESTKFIKEHTLNERELGSPHLSSGGGKVTRAASAAVTHQCLS
jgi:serine/threonine protein kinase